MNARVVFLLIAVSPCRCFIACLPAFDMVSTLTIFNSGETHLGHHTNVFGCDVAEPEADIFKTCSLSLDVCNLASGFVAGPRTLSANPPDLPWVLNSVQLATSRQRCTAMRQHDSIATSSVSMGNTMQLEKKSSLHRWMR